MFGIKLKVRKITVLQIVDIVHDLPVWGFIYDLIRIKTVDFEMIWWVSSELLIEFFFRNISSIRLAFV